MKSTKRSIRRHHNARLKRARQHYWGFHKDKMPKAEPFKVTSYYTCRSREEVQTAIMECGAVQIGIPVFRNFYYPNDKGIIQYQKGQRSLGGHSVTLIGWAEIDDR